MRHAFSVFLVLALVNPGGLSAQTPPLSPPPAKKSATAGSKDLAHKLVDTTATAAAAMATDTLLGKNAAAVAGVVAAVGPGGVPTCAAGQVLYPAPDAAVPGAQQSMAGGAMASMMPSAGASIIDAAKKKLLKKPDTTAAGAATATAAVSAAPTFLCGTPQQATASMQAAALAAQAPQAAQGGMPSVGSMLAATPQGMMVNGAIAAAPMAGAAAKKVGGFLRGAQSKESMAGDLAKGKLVLKGVKFVEGTDMLVADAENDIALLIEALKSVDGQFILNVPAESDGKSPPDMELAKRRLTKVAVHIAVGGIGDERVTTRGVQPPGLDPKTAAPKPGAARAELVRAPKEPKP